ncbi:hypothetical protein [Maricaulis maris]|uniref:hypothetical protein n=1 Tax=Maricaulis maris TaxID=74318 RepID=UPI003B8E6E66
MTSIQLSIPSTRIGQLVWRALIALSLGNALALGLVHYGGITDGWGIVTLLHFDREQNLPTLFSVLLLLGASGLAVRQASIQPDQTVLRTGWYTVATVLALMAIDEFVSVHERVDAAMRYYLGTDVLPYAAWPIPYVLGLAALGAILWRWFVALGLWRALALMTAGAIYLGGAVGMEFIAGEYLTRLDPHHAGVTDLTRDLLATLEETLEMIGLILLIQTLVRTPGKRAKQE